jgi:hypothetical protein
VTLESGVTKAIADVEVGDRVLTVNCKGQAVYSDVVYLPHGPNQQAATFAVIATESGSDLKMTMNHVLPAGACALSSLPLVAARQIAVGDCVQTVSGREQVVSVGKVEGQGIYTIVAMEELIVVNGIVATPFGGVNPTLANTYYNLHRLVYSFSFSFSYSYSFLYSHSHSYSYFHPYPYPYSAPPVRRGTGTSATAAGAVSWLARATAMLWEAICAA